VRFDQANPVTGIVTLCSALFLIVGKELVMKLVNKFVNGNVPIPFELLLV
jgi:hypothetical protein